MSSKCNIRCYMYFVDLGQYISQPSSEPTCGRKRLSRVEGDCLVSGVVALISRRVTSRSSPQAWTRVVRC